MATSGSFTTSEYEGRSLTFSWNRTNYSVESNTSTIAWTVTGSGSYTYGWVTCGDIDVVINGSTVYNSSSDNRVNIWNGTVVASGTYTLAHNADGTKSFGASINAAVYNYAQNVSGSNSWSLNTIPRASSIDKVANVNGTGLNTSNTGTKLRIYFTPKTTSFKYRASASMNGNSVQNNSSGVSVSGTSQTYFEFSVPHSWLPNSTSGTLVCKLETLNGSAIIGTHTINVSMTVPTSVVPTLGTLSVSPQNSNSVVAGWGIYVANYSKARLTCSASGSGGSTIKTFHISGAEHKTVSGTSLSYDSSLTSDGSKQYTVYAVDSRGRATASQSVTVNVATYYPPTIISCNVLRTDKNGNADGNGTYAKLSFSGTYSNIGTNAANATFSYKLSTASAYTALNNNKAGASGKFNDSFIITNINFATASEYDFKIQISDSMGNSIARTVRLGTVTRTLNIAKYGNGVAIGKISTVSNKSAVGKFEIGWDADFDKNVNIDGSETVGGDLSTGGNLSVAKAIHMGGLKGQTNEQQIIFSNPDSSTYSHNTYIYGGDPDSPRAVGMWDGKHQRHVFSYSDNDNSIRIGQGAHIYFNDFHLYDVVIEDGSSGKWTYRKWANGLAECWRSITGKVTKYTTWNGMYGYQGSAEWPSGLFIENPNAQYQVKIGSGFAMPAGGAMSTTSRFVWYALSSESTDNVDYVVDVYAVGRWK